MGFSKQNVVAKLLNVTTDFKSLDSHKCKALKHTLIIRLLLAMSMTAVLAFLGFCSAFTG